ncbi:MAG TPA: DUF6599 family protein [Candidatus Acidoferrales bacterium]|nr:DUF6599 family protein [Candidatus Acidoferrales bacterium]
MRHYFSLSLAAVLLSFAATSSSAQQVVPDSFVGWSCNGRTAFNPAQPSEIASQTASSVGNDVLAEYGFVAGEQCEYTRGSERLGVQIYRMKDPSGAYGLYSYMRTADLPHSTLTGHSALGPSRALALDGNLLLDIRGTELPKREKDLKALVAAVKVHAEEGPLPSLPDEMPTLGMVERSDHYVLGPATLYQFVPVASSDWLGFSQGAEAESARYRAEGHELTLLLADFPTPQTAAKKLAELQKVYHVNGTNPEPGAPPIFAKRSMTLLAIVYGARTQGEADALLKQVESGAEITWNEPTFQFKEPPITAMIAGTIIGAGIICMFAIISGIAFGGFRLVVKRYFPDKVFDRSSHLQVLQLGLGSKPINSEDFYGLERPPRK